LITNQRTGKLNFLHSNVLIRLLEYSINNNQQENGAMATIISGTSKAIIAITFRNATDRNLYFAFGNIVSDNVSKCHTPPLLGATTKK